MDQITVETLKNGQKIVTKGNLTLIQTRINGRRLNDCSVNHKDYIEIVSEDDLRFKELYIALAQYD